MVRKKKKAAGQEEQKPWCFYCDRQFNDESILIQHQKSRHFKCSQCHKKLNTAQGLAIHCIQVHKLAVDAVPNAKPGREAMDKEIFGMAGVPAGMEPGAALPEGYGEEDEPPAKIQRVDSGQASTPASSYAASQAPHSAGYYNPAPIPLPGYGYPGYNPYAMRPPPGYPPTMYPGHPGYPPPYGSAPMQQPPPGYPPYTSQPPPAAQPGAAPGSTPAGTGVGGPLFPISQAPSTSSSGQLPAASAAAQPAAAAAAASLPAPTVQPPPAMPALFPIAQPASQPPPVGLQPPPLQSSGSSNPPASGQASQQIPAAASTPSKLPPEMGFVWDDDNTSMEEQRASSQKYAQHKAAGANGMQAPQSAPASASWPAPL